MLLPERLEGAVYGHLCGDALGVPYEFLPADRHRRGRMDAVAVSHDQPAGHVER